jgi:CheY-like chemotaxis protein
VFRFTAQFARGVAAVVASPLASVRSEPVRRLRILVAEDNELNVALLETLLAQRGHHAVFAYDGREALELARTEDFDLMLLDLHMPELDGFEVVAAIRARERGTDRHLRVVALTARSSARDRELCLAAGMDEFLAKPIEVAALWATIDRLMDRWPAVPSVPAILEKLRLVLRRTLPVQLARIATELANEDLPQLADAAHQVVASVGAFSTVAADAAAMLEDAARQGNGGGCAPLVSRLATLCDALLAATERAIE